MESPYEQTHVHFLVSLLLASISSLPIRRATMRIRKLDFKWYDGFFLSMLATSAIVVSLNWKKYHSCVYPLHIWVVVDYAVVFLFRILMFVDNGLAAGLRADIDQWGKAFRYYGRIVVLSCLSLLFYPFLWAWTIIGSLWFTSARSCLPEEGQKWGFIVWLLFSYCGLICIACICTGKWLVRRQAHLQRFQQGSPISELEVLVDLIRAPDWAHQNARSSQEIHGMVHEVPVYHPGLYLSQVQREAVDALIQQLPKFRLKSVPTECNECPICLEEFQVGNEVRGLPCAHNFHVACIDKWLRINIRCPRCRCCVFPNLDLSAVSNYYPQHVPRANILDSNIGSASMPNGRYVRAQPMGQSNLVRLQEILRTIRMEYAVHDESSANELRAISSQL